VALKRPWFDLAPLLIHGARNPEQPRAFFLPKSRPPCYRNCVQTAVQALRSLQPMYSSAVPPIRPPSRRALPHWLCSDDGCDRRFTVVTPKPQLSAIKLTGLSSEKAIFSAVKRVCLQPEYSSSAVI
jgi:hypothetical protein